MKKIISLFSMLIALIFSVNGQDFQGVATYKTKRKIDIKLDSTQVNSEIHQRMIAMMKKQFEKTYLLTFNKEASLYKEDKGLERQQSGGMRIMVMAAGQSDILYKNIKEDRFTSQSDVMGKVFLVKDVLQKQDWTLQNETKHIGNYTCHKATFKRMVEVVETGISINGDKDLDANNNEEPKMREVTVTAWYTMEIPVNTGPNRFHGLPGLILEVNDGEETIVCSKIVLNPKDEVVIKEPTKGEKVNRDDFNKIVEKKLREQREQYEHRRDDTNSQRVQIRIGG